MNFSLKNIFFVAFSDYGYYKCETAFKSSDKRKKRETIRQKDYTD